MAPVSSLEDGLDYGIFPERLDVTCGHGLLSGRAAFLRLGLRLDSSLKTPLSPVEISGMVGGGCIPVMVPGMLFVCYVVKAEQNWWFKMSAFILLSLNVRMNLPPTGTIFLFVARCVFY